MGAWRSNFQRAEAVAKGVPGTQLRRLTAGHRWVCHCRSISSPEPPARSRSLIYHAGLHARTRRRRSGPSPASSTRRRAHEAAGPPMPDRRAGGGRPGQGIHAHFAEQPAVHLPGGQAPRREARTAWSTPGTSTSAWSPSTCPVPPPTTRAASAAAWASATPRRTCWALCTSSRSCARERILDIAATQLEDGSAYHQYQPLTKKGNIRHRLRLQRRPAVADRRRRPPTSSETGDIVHPRRAWSPIDSDALQRQAPVWNTCAAPSATLTDTPRPPRAAADWPRRLERLPEPELLLRDAGRVLPDDRPTARAPGGRVRVHRRHVSLSTWNEYCQALCKISGHGRRGGRCAYEELQAWIHDRVMNAGWDGEWFLPRLRRLRPQGRRPASARKARSSSSPRASASWRASASRTGLAVKALQLRAQTWLDTQVRRLLCC